MAVRAGRDGICSSCLAYVVCQSRGFRAVIPGYGASSTNNRLYLSAPARHDTMRQNDGIKHRYLVPYSLAFPFLR